MSQRRLAVINLSMYGYGVVRQIGNSGAYTTEKGIVSTDELTHIEVDCGVYD